MRIFVEKNNTTLHTFKISHKKQLFENELVDTDESQLFDVIEETVDRYALEIRKGDRELYSQSLVHQRKSDAESSHD